LPPENLLLRSSALRGRTSKLLHHGGAWRAHGGVLASSRRWP